MNDINKTYHLELECVTPLHIGAGSEADWILGVDFLYSDQQLCKINIRDVIKLLGGNQQLLNVLSSSNNRNESMIACIGKENLELLSDFSNELPKGWSIDYFSNPVKSFLRNSLTTNPLFAGSSLKGAIRSILFSYLRTNERERKDIDFLFGKASEGTDFLRFIKITDGEFDRTTFVNTKIFNLRTPYESGWKHSGRSTTDKFNNIGFNTVYETLVPGDKSAVRISYLSDDILEKLSGKIFKSFNEKKMVLMSDISFLFHIINDHTRNYLKKQLSFFKKYNQAERSKDIIDSIEELLKRIPDDNEGCLLDMSAGSGFHSITGDWMFNDFSITEIDSNRGRSRGLGIDTSGRLSKSAKSRKIAIYNDTLNLMGFVILRKISKDKYEKFLADRIEIDKLNKEKREEKRGCIKSSDEIQREKEKEFQTLVDKAISFEEQNQFDSALEFYTKAYDVIPKNEIRETMDNVLDKIERQKQEEAQRKIEEGKRAEEEAKRERNKQPLSERIKAINKFGTLFTQVAKWMKDNGIETLSDEDNKSLKGKIQEIYSTLNPRDQKKMKSFGKDLEKIISKELAEKWFSEITK